MLLARARETTTVATTPLRGVFARDDAWLSTGDLFRRDARRRLLAPGQRPRT